MAPRKRARLSKAAGSSPLLSNRGRSTSAMPSPSPSASESAHQPLSDDPWTDAEETALFKQLIRYKPTGLHKHMSMLSIYTALMAQGYVREDPFPTPSLDGGEDSKALVEGDDRHMSIPGIWRKLNQLYDLEALDEREEEVDFAVAFGEDPSAAEASSEKEEEPEPTPARRGRPRKKAATEESEGSSPSPAPIGREFELPSSDESDTSMGSTASRTHTSFAALKWAKRFATASPSIEASSPSPAHTKRGRPSGRSRKDGERERRDSSPAELPELLSSRTDVPVRFTPSFEVPEEDGASATPQPSKGRGRGRPQARGRASTATAGRRNSRAVQDSGSEEKEVDESEEEGDEEADSEEEESESGEEADEESPQKKKRGRRSTGRARGAGRSRGRKK